MQLSDNQLKTYDNLSSKKQLLVDWILTPKNSRNPETMQELADEVGVSVSTLYKWKQKDIDIKHLIEEVEEDKIFNEVRQIILNSLPDVIKAVVERAVVVEGNGVQYAHKNLELLIDILEEWGGSGVDGDSEDKPDRQEELSTEKELLDKLNQINDRQKANEGTH